MQKQFQIIRFGVITQFSSIWPIDRTLSGATTPGQSEPWSNSNEGVLRIPPNSRITETSPWDCHIQDIRWEKFYPSAEMQSMYSAAPADCHSEMLSSITI